MATVGKIDKLTRSFLTGTSNPFYPFDQFNDLQDPTYMSFKLNFFPQIGLGMLDDSYSTSGLFRPPDSGSLETLFYKDSAYEYLKNIGSPARQSYHRAFTQMLWKIQEEAPWYFQSVSGLGELYKIDPQQNFRGKDKILTIDCLESIDLRMSYLADLYRNMAFDMQNMREILPINLRTFNMEIYVLEFRRFNTTFGTIADHFAKPTRAIGKENLQKISLGKNNRNAYKTNLSAGLFNNFLGLSDQLLGAFGGIGGLFGNGSGAQSQDIESAFEAVSIHTFVLKDCEFDFFSEAPPYLDVVSVADNSTPAMFKFKIKVGRIEKVGMYPFHKFIVAEHVAHTFFNEAYVKGLKIPGADYPLDFSDPYLEPYKQKDIPEKDLMAIFRDARENVFPSYYTPNKADSEAYKEAQASSDYLRRKPLERLLGGILQNSANSLTETMNKKFAELTGGTINQKPLGNVYGRPAILERLRTGLSDFLPPGQPEQLQQAGVAKEKNILDKPNDPTPFVKTDILQSPETSNPWRKHNVFGSDGPAMD